MRVLVACEMSGMVRRAFRDRGHDAWSCDLLPAEDGSEFHFQCDVRRVLYRSWDLVIAHPVCRYLTNAGVKHLYIGGKRENGWDVHRWADMGAACEFFKMFIGCAPRVCIENPIMHGYAAKRIGSRATQFVQPWWFGDPEFKAIGLHLENLPKLVPTNRLTPPAVGTEEHKRWSRVHRMPPGPDREKERSRFFPGASAAMADQWGAFEMREAA